MSRKEEIEVRSKVFWEGALKTRSVIRGFEVFTDKPRSDFGTNDAPAPMEIFVSAMGACLLSTFVWAAYRSHTKIEDCAMDVRATSAGTGEDGVSGAEFKLTVWAKGDYKRKLEKCFDIARSSCSLTSSVSFPLEFSMVFKEEG